MLCGLLLEGCEERWCEAGRPTSGDAFYAYQTMRAALGDEAERFVLSPAVLNLVGDLSGDEAHIERQHHLVRAPYPVTVPEIAAEIGVNEQTVRKWLPAGPPPQILAMRRRVRELRKQGLGVRATAREAGCSTNFVERWGRPSPILEQRAVAAN